MKSATRLAKGDVATEVTDAAAEANMNVKAKATEEVAVADAVGIEAKDMVKSAKKP